jgi:hypothetical protein
VDGRPEHRLSEGVEVIAQADERLALLGIGEIDAVQAKPQGVGQRVGNDQQQDQYHGGKHRHSQGTLRELTAVHTRSARRWPLPQGHCAQPYTEGR